MVMQYYNESITSSPSPTTVGPTCLDRARPTRTGRVEYCRVRNGWPALVIVDFLPGGIEDFAEQEFGEVRWFSYTPSERERTFALQLLGELSFIKG
jgi:hypothetical protein